MHAAHSGTPTKAIFSYQRGSVFVHRYPVRHIQALVANSRDLGDWTIHTPRGKRFDCRTYQHPNEGTFYTPKEGRQ